MRVRRPLYEVSLRLSLFLDIGKSLSQNCRLIRFRSLLQNSTAECHRYFEGARQDSGVKCGAFFGSGVLNTLTIGSHGKGGVSNCE